MDDTRACLQCGETKASIKAQGIVLCGIVSGYYEPELTDEWPRHRWADWRDSELAMMGLRPEAYEKHRRSRIFDIQWAGCEETIRGHIIATEDDVEWGLKRGQCVTCGKIPGASS